MTAMCESPSVWDSAVAWWTVNLRRPHAGTWGAQSPAKVRASEAGEILQVILGRHSENVSSEADSAGVCTFIPRILTVGFIFAFQKLFLDPAFSLWVSIVSFRSSNAFEILSYQPLCAQPAPGILIFPTFMSPLFFSWKGMIPHIQWLRWHSLAPLAGHSERAWPC